MVRYYFGVPDWRRRARRIALGVAVALAGLAAGTALRTRAAYVAGLVVVFVGLWYGQPALKRLLVPAPWQPDAWKYAPLRRALDPADADRWLDVGCGTGRSLVGLATAADPEDGPARPGEGTAAGSAASLAGVRVTGVDGFDGRTLLGDDAHRTERNAAAAGLDATAVRGDADRLPVRTASQDVVTACRLLSDLPDETAERAVREARRTLTEDGRFGVLEAVGVGERPDDPLDRWRAVLADGGFELTEGGTIRQGGSRYVYLAATPA